MRVAVLVIAIVAAGATPAASAPAWLDLGLEHLTRYEYLSHDFRANASHDASGLSIRTLGRAEARFALLRAGAELADARVYATDATPLNTTHANALEVLQAYLGMRATGLVSAKDVLDVRAGRITIDLATRRVVARNRFRTTINGFTGVDAAWTSARKHVARAFVAVPVTRFPGDADAIRDNAIELDDENTDALLWCAYYGSPQLAAGTLLEAYGVGFHERDGAVTSRNRQLFTLGVRWYRKPARGTVDFELEVLPQLGTSRATTAADDTTDLDHRAWSSHVEIGVSPAVDWKPRVAMLHDYASGDRDPTDGTTQRFDPLFGARRFDFGPTGFYGPVNRSNLQSPGARIAFAPTTTLDLAVTYRWYWLAARRDAWVAANVRDATGSSGSFVGEHAEVQLRWTLMRNLSLEGGAAYLRRGELAKTAPDTRQANAAYVYTQLNVTL